jgi:hypothetical protein
LPQPKLPRPSNLDDAALVTSCLVALGGDRRLEAVTALRAMTKTATTGRSTRGVA